MTIKNKNFNLQEMIAFETQRIIDEILGESLTHSEEKEQNITAALIKSRGVKAPANSRKTKDDDDAERKKNRNKSNNDKKLNQQHQEADEEEEEPKKKKTGEEAVFDEPEEEKNSGKREDRTGGKGTSDSPKLKPSRETLLDPSFDDIINNVALIRGGKSAKNPEIKKALRRYYDEMSQTERRALNVFLLGVAQVLSTIADPVDPNDANIKLDAKKSIETTSNKKSTVASRTVAKSGTQENPIVVGESANKSREFAILASYRR